MKTVVTIVCDSQAESQFAQQQFVNWGFTILGVAQCQRADFVELQGQSPNYRFVPIGGRLAPNIWVVTAQK